MTRKIKAEAKELNTETALAKEDWSADTSPEAVKQRIKALEGNMTNVSLNGGDDDGSDDDANSPYSVLGRWIEDNRDSEDPKAFSIAIYKRAEELGIDKKHKTVLVLVQALYTQNVLTQIPQYAALFAKVSSLSFRGYVSQFIHRWYPPRSTRRLCSVVLSASSA